MAHDDDWCDILRDDTGSEIQDPPELLQQISERFDVAEKDGAASLILKSAFSTNTTVQPVSVSAPVLLPQPKFKRPREPERIIDSKEDETDVDTEEERRKPCAVPGPTLNQQFAIQPSNPPFQQLPTGQEGRHFPPIPPLEKGRFETVYKNFCAQRSLVHNARMMSLEARPIDLYELHTQVMLEGGSPNVAQKDLWSVIGGRMGFVQFPGSDTEPPKSGPGVAQHLAHVYQVYLAAFDHIYATTVMESRRKKDAVMQRVGNAATVNGPPQIRPSLSDPSQMQLVMAYANILEIELRRRGAPEQLIQFIEINRSTLLRRAAEQAVFQNQFPPWSGGMYQGGHGSPPAGGMMQPGRQFMPPGMQPNPMENPQPPQNVFVGPSPAHFQAAMAYIARLKSGYSPEQMMQNVPRIDVPAEQRMEYNTVLEQLYRACNELDHKLPMIFAVFKKEDVVRRLVIAVQTAIHQRAMISSGDTRFLVGLDTLYTMLQQVLHMTDSFARILQGFQLSPLTRPRSATPPPVPAVSMASPKSPQSKPRPKPPAKGKQSIKAAAPPPLPQPEPVAASLAGSNKRAREEPSPPHQGQGSNPSGPSVMNEPSQPKRQKRWEGPPNDAIKARPEQVENVKTEEDGAAFHEQMAELFKMTARNNGEETLISEFLEPLPALFDTGFGTDEGASGMSSLPVGDEFVNSFDFSSFKRDDEDDAGSREATLDLISSSSVNPRPESGSEVDAAHQALTSFDVKSEDFSS
ncbi:hypothetical protein C8R44DRAFT_103842 [Mycena epipterygia]|nr:hypothetical protein C8R44DRAFT_103842 [Mycena epipterygia]